MDPYDCASRFRDPYDPFDYAPGLGGPEELPSFAGPGRDIVYDAPINCYQIYEDLRGACARGEVDGRCAELDDWLRACLASTSFRRMAGGF